MLVPASAWAQSVETERDTAPRSAMGDGVSGVVPLALAASKRAAPITHVRLEPLDVEGLLAEDAERATTSDLKWRRVGVVRAFAPASPPRRFDGARTWTFEVHAPGATALRPHVSRMDLPPGVELIAYDADEPSESYGPWTGSGAFYLPSIFTDRARLELRVATDSSRAEVVLEIDGVAQWYVEPEDALADGPTKAGPCHNDVACDAHVLANEALAVARFTGVAGGGVFSCTGSLLADSDPATFVPWFATANHCVPNEATAKTVECFWDYRASTCNGVAPSLASRPRTRGASLMATSGSFDFSLLRLTGNLPTGRVFAGWNANFPRANQPVFGVHHPFSREMSVSYGTLVVRGSNFHQVAWNSGVVDPGSSGSPLYDENRAMIGVLSGGASSCDNPTGRDFYGRFDRAFANLQLGRFLLGQGTGDAWDPTDDFGSGATPLAPPTADEQVHAQHSTDLTDIGDWFVVELEKGGRYRFWSSGTGDVRCSIYDGPLGLIGLASDDNGGGDQAFQIDLKATRSGPFYLRVRGGVASPNALYALHYVLTTPEPKAVATLTTRVKRNGRVVFKWGDEGPNASQYLVEREVDGHWESVGQTNGKARKFVHKPGPGTGSHVYRLGARNVRGTAYLPAQVDVVGANDDVADPADDRADGAVHLPGAFGLTERRTLSGTDHADWYGLDVQAHRAHDVSSRGKSRLRGTVFATPDASTEPLATDAKGGRGGNFSVHFSSEVDGSVWLRVETIKVGRRARYHLVWSSGLGP